MSLTYLSKVSALTVLAISIAACSSGGGHTQAAPNTPPLTDQSAAKKVEANRLVLLDKAKKAGLNDKQAADYAEANKEANPAAAQATLEALVAEKVAAENAAAEKAAAEKAEKKRLQIIEANRLVLLDKAKKAGLNDKQAADYAEANKEANLAIAQANLEALVAEKVAAENAAAEKAAAEKAEKERLQKVEANRLVLLDKAKKAGLNDKQAADYAEANKEANPAAAQATLEALVAQNEDLAFENALYKAKGEYYKAPKGDLFIPKELKEKSCNTNGSCTETISHKVIYNQDYSVVVGDYTSLKHTQSGSENKYGQTSSIEVKGIKTNADSIPKLGSAIYSGKAFKRSGNLHQGAGTAKLGKVNYSVNFESRKGSGVIILNDNIRLNEGTISGSGITSTATTQVFDQTQGKILYKNGEYTLDFYGKKAEEIAGKVMFDGEDVAGFGGTRGEISK